MRKIVILLDDWISNKNFIGNELELIKQLFDTTVVCDYNENLKESDFPSGIKFIQYKREKNLAIIPALFKALFDKETYAEIKRLKTEDNKLSKISEIIRFYINSELFYGFLKKNNLISDDTDALYYSYWYFFKCFAVTNHKKSPKMNIITRTHEYDLYTVSIPSGYQPFKYAMDKNLDKVIFIAEHGRQYYLNKYGFKPSDKYMLCHLGTKDYGTLNPYKKTDTLSIVSCSSVIKRKRVDLILNALSEVNNVNVEWIHFGNGDEFEALKALALEKLDSKSNIKYNLKGFTKHEEVMKYYCENSVDLLIMAAISEGNPVSVIEAMSFGIPIISANICNMPNLVKGNGILLSESPTPSELASAIESFAALDSESIQKMRTLSRTLWEQDYQESENIEYFVSSVLLK